MRELIIISASRAMVMEPSRNWAMNSLIRLRPRSLEAGSTPKRPSSTIWSRSPFSATCSVTVAVVAAVLDCGSGILGSLYFRLQLVEFFCVADGVKQEFFQLVIALQAAAEIRETLTEIEEFLERFDLASYVFRLEVFHALAIQIDLEIGRIGLVAQFVFDGESQMRLHPLENGIEVVGIDFDELAVFQLRKRFGGLAGEISQDAHDKRQFLQFDGTASFHIIGNMDTRGPDTI